MVSYIEKRKLVSVSSVSVEQKARRVWERTNEICMNKSWGAGRWAEVWHLTASTGETPSDTAEISPETTAPTLNPHLCVHPHWTPADKLCLANTDIRLSTWESRGGKVWLVSTTVRSCWSMSKHLGAKCVIKSVLFQATC